MTRHITIDLTEDEWLQWQGYFGSLPDWPKGIPVKQGSIAAYLESKIDNGQILYDPAAKAKMEGSPWTKHVTINISDEKWGQWYPWFKSQPDWDFQPPISPGKIGYYIKEKVMSGQLVFLKDAGDWTKVERIPFNPFLTGGMPLE